MPLSDGIALRIATADDLPEIARLRYAVGWAVHDWALEAVLAEPHARCLVAVDASERMVGVGSGISYGRIGVVGNMVVDPAHRRRGIGATILESVLEFLDGRAVSRFELSATDLGRPLYARYGFEPDGPGISTVVARGQVPTRDGGDGVRVDEAGRESMAELAAYDAPRFGGDRAPVLATMLSDTRRPVLVARRDGATVGWGWIRPEVDRLGPLVADTPAVAQALISEALQRLPGAETLRLNMPAGNRVGAETLGGLGATLEEWGGRMARGPNVPRRDDTIYANAVGALG